MSHLAQILNHLSLWMILLAMVLSELGFPLPETVFVVAAGVVSERQDYGLMIPIVASSIAVLVGDLLLFGLARQFGQNAFERRPLCWLLPPRALPRIDALLARHGSMAIFVARFISGVRAATFVLAGMRRIPVTRFLIWDGLAVLVTVPIFAVIGFTFSRRLGSLETQVRQVNQISLALLVGAIAIYVAVAILRRPGSGDRRN